MNNNEAILDRLQALAQIWQEQIDQLKDAPVERGPRSGEQRRSRQTCIAVKTANLDQLKAVIRSLPGEKQMKENMIDKLIDSLHEYCKQQTDIGYDCIYRLPVGPTARKQTTAIISEWLQQALSPVLPEQSKSVIAGLDEAATFYINRSPVATGEEIGLANKCQDAINYIERLWRQVALNKNHAEHFAAKCDDLLARIEELEKPVLPEDVADLLRETEREILKKSTSDWLGALLRRLHRMLERLAREKEERADNAADLFVTCTEMQASIEELETELAKYKPIYRPEQGDEQNNN